MGRGEARLSAARDWTTSTSISALGGLACFTFLQGCFLFFKYPEPMILLQTLNLQLSVLHILYVRGSALFKAVLGRKQQQALSRYLLLRRAAPPAELYQATVRSQELFVERPL